MLVMSYEKWNLKEILQSSAFKNYQKAENDFFLLYCNIYIF